VEAYDALSLSPATVVARVLASHRTSAFRISSATASAVFAASSASRVLMFGSRKKAICASLRRRVRFRRPLAGVSSRLERLCPRRGGHAGAVRASVVGCRFDDCEGRGRCKGSRASDRRKDFSQCMQQSATRSTSNVILHRQERTERFGPRRCRHGTKSSPRREPDVPAELLRALFGNVTKPARRFAELRPQRRSGCRHRPTRFGDRHATALYP
jgi:hypothetical protein